MPQGQLKVKKTASTKKEAANRHGKSVLSKKGAIQRPPKKARLQAQYDEQQGITKAINAKNEEAVASNAQSGGGKLSVLKAPIKAVAPKNKTNKTAELAKKAEKNQFTL